MENGCHFNTKRGINSNSNGIDHILQMIFPPNRSRKMSLNKSGVALGHILIFGILFYSQYTHAQLTRPIVHAVGAMKNVMWQGKLHPTIYLDSMDDKNNLYGLGPLEFLQGEITILDGKCYTSIVMEDSLIVVREGFNFGAPFFVYARVEGWQDIAIPDGVVNLHQLEKFLESIANDHSNPFPFKMTGEVQHAMYHIVRLKKGLKVQSPDDVHKSKIYFNFNSEPVEMIGFFSKHHQSIFTHHDSFIHVHVISKDFKKMGHLDSLSMDPKKIKLYLPK
ncbi:MAG: acetolactate decarboxylase [Saprospiraceae bacterium]|nr:acetolactate decarboxylase [Saprospiraceae bacterium]